MHKRKRVGLLFYPTAVFEYYATHKYVPNPEDSKPFRKRKALVKELESNSEFQLFWNECLKRKPGNEIYCSRLITPRLRFHPEGAKKEYEKFLQSRNFNNLSSEEMCSLEAEMSILRKLAYKQKIEYWAERSGCKDFCATFPVPVLALGQFDDPLRLEDLPNDVFLRILEYLSLSDIIKVTFVCNEWRKLIYYNERALKKAEYHFVSYLADYVGWKDDFVCPESMSDPLKDNSYMTISFRLTKWYLQRFKQVETVVFHHPINVQKLADLFQECSTLKRLVLYEVVMDYKDSKSVKDVQIRDGAFTSLEVFMCHHDESTVLYCSACEQVLKSSSSLRALLCPNIPVTSKNALLRRSCYKILPSLLVLEVSNYNEALLARIAKADDLQLKYLSLGCSYKKEFRARFLKSELRIQEYFDQVLAKMVHLEVLILQDQFFGFDKDTLKLIVELKLNLRFGIFWINAANKYTANSSTSKRSTVDYGTLENFKEMLLLHDPDRNLSDIVFVEEDPDLRENFISKGLGFTFSSSPCFSRATIGRLKNAFEDPILSDYLNLRY